VYVGAISRVTHAEPNTFSTTTMIGMCAEQHNVFGASVSRIYAAISLTVRFTK